MLKRRVSSFAPLWMLSDMSVLLSALNDFRQWNGAPLPPVISIDVMRVVLPMTRLSITPWTFEIPCIGVPVALIRQF